MNLSIDLDNTDETQEPSQNLMEENLIDSLAETNSTIDVINKKSNELIQKVSCEIATEDLSTELNLFDS